MNQYKVEVIGTLDGLMKEINKFSRNQSRKTMKEKITRNFSTIDDCRNTQQEIMNNQSISTIQRGWLCNQLEEQIELLKVEIKELVDKY